jgi:hypothetical protein
MFEGKRSAYAGIVATLLFFVSACVAPPPGDGGGYHGRQQQAQSDRWDWRDVEGFWCFGNSTNELTFRDNGRTLIAQPINRRGGAATRRFEGRGVYRDVRKGQATYEFLSPEEVIWRSNDKRNLVYRLHPC